MFLNTGRLENLALNSGQWYPLIMENNLAKIIQWGSLERCHRGRSSFDLIPQIYTDDSHIIENN